MKFLIFQTIIFTVILSCKSSDKIDMIESAFELEIPKCYTILEDPEEKFDYNSKIIIELKFEDDCMWKMYDEQMIAMNGKCRKYYIGTTPVVWDAPLWHNYEQKAIMYLDLESRMLHFESY